MKKLAKSNSYKKFSLTAIVTMALPMMLGACGASWAEEQAGQAGTSITESRRIIVDSHQGHAHELPLEERQVGTQEDFLRWLKDNPHQKTAADSYQAYLVRALGSYNLPPMHQLLTTARSWQQCGYEPYQIPPRELWENMLPTLRLYVKLQTLGILPRNTEIRSVYRSPDLNKCAGGAPSSKHLTNGAIDIWVPTYHKDSWQMNELQNRLCQFWIDEGQMHQFGLGIYATGAIHLDTQGWRKWGGQFTQVGSPCRYVRPELLEPAQERLYIDGVGFQ
ncbi:MAG: D-Ala-D-Ala carboxypeptidase family metallohydrolase [Moraxella sp.]|nr:D-Ala-D-Ala carboxypeptidase family metallohydrolase [Moraxella sp.]